MVSRHGLTELYSPPQGTKVIAHIVFVHGLFGHPEKTWSSKKSRSSSSNSSTTADERLQHTEQIDNNGISVSTFWPQTLLPTVIPDAKISTWGYDANVDGFLSSASQNTIYQHAQNLLSDLADLSGTDFESFGLRHYHSGLSPKDLPIIFVVHSLGGIIVKEALNQSSSTVGTRLKEIAPLVFGMCFLGTPHRGSKSASLGKMAYNLTVIVSKRPNLRLLQGLERNSETLDRVGTAFTQTLLKHDIAICSFREEHETRKYLIFNTIVVDADSAKIGDGKEEVSSIPADHSNMTKFESTSDVGFRRVSAQLRRWVETIRSLDTAIPLQDQEDCLASLSDTITRARIVEVHDAHEKTFHWLYDPAVVSFPSWLSDTSSSRPIYWIQGKPGSGKSTLMKFAMRDPRMTELLASDDMEQWSLAAFFFHDRGSEKQKTLNGMLQELLRSILQQIPALSRYVLSSYIELVQAQRTRCPSWDFSSLKSALVSLFEQRHVKIRILLLLDALDEHQGDNDLLASLLKSLVDKSDNKCVRLKMCLASRSWTVFQQHFGNCPGFSIHDHTREDIMTYIRARLEPCGRQETDQLGRDSMTQLVDLVATRASGVFIWVRLVVDMLAKGIQDGTPHRTLEEKVDRIPRELRDLYADTLRRIESEYSSEAFIMLQTALCSFEPLPLKVFMAISNLPVGYPELRDEPTSSHKSRLASRSGGLLELIQRDQSVPESEGLVVQFIHQTVKEYVQSAAKTLGLSPIPLEILRENGYNFILRTCAFYHDEWVSCIKKDVFKYARCAAKKCKEDYGAHDSEYSRLVSVIVKDVMMSLRSSQSGPISLEWFLAQQKGSFCADLLSEVRAYGDWEIHLAKLAVAMNFPEHFMHRPNSSSVIGLSKIPALLNIAVAASHLDTEIRDADHEYMIRVLVGVGCDIDEPHGRMFKHINPTQVIDEYRGVSPLAQTLIDEDGSEEVRLNIAKTLLNLGADVDSSIQCEYADSIGRHSYLLSSLDYCVLYESAAFVRLLLQHGAVTTSSFTNTGGLLRIARLRQDAAVIQTLHDFGVGNINGEDTFNDFPSLTDAMMIQSHIMAAPSGGLSRVVFRDSRMERFRRATADSSWGVANNPDFGAATDSQLHLEVTRPITSSLPAFSYVCRYPSGEISILPEEMHVARRGKKSIITLIYKRHV
ncbi:hypothetical protein JMJ35_006012 [Cladonia borealis]|uniref:Nephrocystin 3-like N-terminal domain-containing protein n=1 Tax=Cladonia borealis TaxID=184061 RepID=A0AA39V4K7_9LECA|nr:hypothetical protein JMJ35_006012 [Cladonia borealis]